MAPKTDAVSIDGVGLVTAIGLGSRASCAALRANVRAPSQTRFVDRRGDWFLAHAVPVALPRQGNRRLSHLLALAVEEALAGLPRERWPDVPLWLCLGEPAPWRSGEEPPEQLLSALEAALGCRFRAGACIVRSGRVGVAVALARARASFGGRRGSQALIVAADRLVDLAALQHFERCGRLLGPDNSDGFLPGEAAGALLIGVPAPGSQPDLLCCGAGFGMEPAPLDSGEPLRADGLTAAIRGALADARCDLHDLDYRITDLSGEQYYFREAELALQRNLRRRKAAFDVWHPAQCIGETGAAVGVAVLAQALDAWRLGYAPGDGVLAHFGCDGGERAALVLRAQA